MAKDAIAIKVENVSKDFSLTSTKATTLKSLFTGLLQSESAEKKEEHTQHALKNVSFEVKKGEFFGIVGRNGSGKSTMLKMLAGIYQPNKGNITTTGKLVPFIELGVGFNPELTGKENVYLNGALLGFDEDEVSVMYEEIVEFAELEEFMGQKLKNYSSGMQVRLAFSMAIRAKADILLIDEVLAVGDADFQRKCFKYFKTLKKNNKTVIFVSHDMASVREYCDRAILIEQHEIQLEGRPETVAEQYIRLFNPKENAADMGVEKKRQQHASRWGDGKVMFTKVRVTQAPGGPVIVKAGVLAKEEIDSPVFGILVKNTEGDPICGTNSRILKIKTGTMAKNEMRDLQWELLPIFSSGSYSIDVAISHPDEITQCDWWHDAGAFDIFNEKNTPFAISPEIHFRMGR